MSALLQQQGEHMPFELPLSDSDDDPFRKELERSLSWHISSHSKL